MYYLSFYLNITGILLHIKAFLDSKLIEIKFKYSEILEEVDEKN